VSIRVAAIAAAGCVLLAPSTSATGVDDRRTPAPTTRVVWADVARFADALGAAGLTEATFPSHVERLRTTHARRVREGDLDHLVFYLLQSTRFTTLPPIEPALSARALVEGLDPPARDAFLQGALTPPPPLPDAVRARITAFVRALDSPAADARLAYFRGLVRTELPGGDSRNAISREYLRVMRFVYEKEFVAQRSASAAAAVADLYRTRGLSTDTAIEAGYLVHLGIGVIKALEPERRIRRVLIVGPGLDLAPRTALVEDGAPQSYQPWAVIDALVSLGLSRLGALEVVAADINPRVVEHLRRARAEPPVLTLASGIRETGTVTMTDEYRDYFTRLGRAIGTEADAPGATSGRPEDPAAPRETTGAANSGRLRKSVRVGGEAARTLHAEALDAVTERFDGPPFDLIVATNVLPYFDEAELMLAMTNVARMLAPGGVFLHNEARSSMADVTTAIGLPFLQSRHAVIATVRGAPAPLYDSVWLHRKKD
jgi:SAM-dependent methyltransferase